LEFSNEQEVENFHCRLNLEEIDEDFIEFILDMCKANNFIMADLSGNLIIPTHMLIHKLIVDQLQNKLTESS
jgi:hypothetical protein